MDKETYDRGLDIRTRVLGKPFVEQAFKNADEFSMPYQQFSTEYCWGAVWGREGLSLKTRSLLNLAMLPILNRPKELKTHIRGALRNGVTKEEIREVFLQVGAYAGIPAAMDAFRVAGETFAEDSKA